MYNYNYQHSGMYTLGILKVLLYRLSGRVLLE